MTKFDILYKLANKIASCSMDYSSSSPFVENHLNDPKICKKFEELTDLLSKQLNKYRKNGN